MVVEYVLYYDPVLPDPDPDHVHQVLHPVLQPPGVLAGCQGVQGQELCRGGGQARHTRLQLKAELLYLQLVVEGGGGAWLGVHQG